MLARYALVTGSPAYESAFAKIIRGTPDNSGAQEFTAAEHAAWVAGKRVQRSLTLGSAIGSAGDGAGLLAPFLLDPNLIFTGDTVADPARQLARVVSGAAPEWRGVSGGNIVSAWLGELGEFPDAAEDLNQPVVRAEKHGTDVIVSWEALQDVRTIIQILRELFAQRKAQVESDAWINGLGSAATPPEPEGIATALDGTSREIAPTTAESFTLPDIAKLYKSVGPVYRANASWLINVDTYLRARTFVSEADATNSKVFNDDETRLLGKPWFEASSVDSFDDLNAAATADNFLAIFGDVRAGVHGV